MGESQSKLPVGARIADRYLVVGGMGVVVRTRGGTSLPAAARRRLAASDEKPPALERMKNLLRRCVR